VPDARAQLAGGVQVEDLDLEVRLRVNGRAIREQVCQSRLRTPALKGSSTGGSSVAGCADLAEIQRA
jgi:hypothetical protein